MSLLLLDRGGCEPITHFEDGLVDDATLVGDRRGLLPDACWRQLKRGIVYSAAERGEGEDAARIRLTCRFRARFWSMTLEDMVQ